MKGAICKLFLCVGVGMMCWGCGAGERDARTEADRTQMRECEKPKTNEAKNENEDMTKEDFMREAIALSCSSVEHGGGPFGAVIVRDGKIIARGSNSVTLLNDPTAHAEVSAIRAACSSEKSFKLEGCELYTSCEPCPMCLAAAYWAGISKIYYGNNRTDAAEIGFDDSFIYDQIDVAPEKRTVPSEPMLRDEALRAFRMWSEKEDKVEY